MEKKFKDISQDPQLLKIIHDALNEDIGSGDHSSLSCISPDKISSAKLIFKDDGIAAGISIAHTILKINDEQCIITGTINDGDVVKKGDIGFVVEGNAQSLLKSERLLLNIMQRLSGIATVTAQAVSRIKNSKTRILDTRKTTPNLRLLEKWAVTVGGGFNHRYGLYDMIMLKDNHVDVAGGVIAAIEKAKKYLSDQHLDLGIEVETRNLEDYARTGVDFISLGMLTHSVKSLDISFKIKL